jgi:hypothetical protein
VAVHYTTFVLPGSTSNLPDDTPFLVIGAEAAADIPALPLITSLHRNCNTGTHSCTPPPCWATFR